MRISDETLRGRTVISSDGQVLGSIQTLYLDESKWQVESVLLELRKDIADQLGVKHSIFRNGTVELPIRMIQSVGDTVILNTSLSEVRHLHQPATTTDQTPAPTMR